MPSGPLRPRAPTLGFASIFRAIVIIRLDPGPGVFSSNRTSSPAVRRFGAMLRNSLDKAQPFLGQVF